MPKPVGQPVDEVPVAGRGAHRGRRVRPHVLSRDPVQAAEADTRPDRVDRGLLGPEHEVVQRALAGGEPSRNRKRPGEVGGLIPELRADVHHDEIARPLSAAGSRRSGAWSSWGRSDDRGKPESLGAVPPEDVLEPGLQLVFVHPGLGCLHRSTEASPVIATARRSRCTSSRSLICLREASSAVTCCTAIDGRPLCRSTSRLESDGSALTSAMPVSRAASGPGTERPAGPVCGARLGFREIEDGGIGAAGSRHQHQPRTGGLDAREIEEVVGFPVVAVLGMVALDTAELARRDNGDTLSQPLQQRGSPGDEPLDRYRSGRGAGLRPGGGRHCERQCHGGRQRPHRITRSNGTAPSTW